MHIKITKGLNIPLKGYPSGSLKILVPSGEASAFSHSPLQIGLCLKTFDDIKFRLLAKTGDVVKIGQPLAEDKSTPGRMFVSPAAGVIKEVRRGPKRSLQEIVIDVSHHEEYLEYPPLDPKKASRDAIIERLLAGGAFASIRSRPFDLLASPQKIPRDIFVKALESAPCVPPAELQVAGFEKEFQTGLDTLAKLTSGNVHLVLSKTTTCKAFSDATEVKKHTAEGPHPIANPSLHIQRIAPIRSVDDNVWSVNTIDVVTIGHLMLRGRYFNERVISLAGPGILPDRTGYFKSRVGCPVNLLTSGRIERGWLRVISGDPLMGIKVETDSFLGLDHSTCCVIPENTHREFLHFMGLGVNKYTFSKAYLSGHLDNSKREYNFTTSLHGEHRPFIDSTLYDEVNPLDVPTMLLVKAVMAEDFELAKTLGLLEVTDEDFALPTFVCPSKMEMTEIMKAGIRQYAREVLS